MRKKIALSNKKSILSAVLAGVILTHTCGVAYADSNINAAVPFSYGNINSDETSQNSVSINLDKYQDYFKSLPPAASEIFKANEHIPIDIDSVLSNMTNKKLISLPGTFTLYRSDEADYCMPSCVESVLKYINHSSPSQKSIDDELQKDTLKLSAYLNEHQNKNAYMLKTGAELTEGVLANCIFYDIFCLGVPTFIRITDTSCDSWYYPSDGHIVLAIGIYDDLSRILIADPYECGVSCLPNFYEVDISTISSFTTHICW